MPCRNSAQDNNVVCVCHNVTVREIRKAISDGAKTFEEVQQATGCSRGCAMCMESIRNLVQQFLIEN